MTIRRELIDELLKDYETPQDILAEDGLLKQLTKAVIERCLETELDTHLNASKLIMRPERVAKEQLDPCPAQMDCRYDEAHQRESGPVSENGAPHPRAGARNHGGDDYGSRPVARRARATQCGWHPDHRQG